MDIAISRRPHFGRLSSQTAIGCLALMANAVFGVTSALAQCTSGAAGPASLSVTDASTTQALELMRDRRMQVAQACPTGSFPSASGLCTPVTPAAATSVGPAAPIAAPPGAPAQTKRPPGSPGAGSPYGGGGLKDAGIDPPTRVRYGAWADGYGDYERRTDVAPEGQRITFKSFGILSGMDHTYLRSAREGIQLGAFAGYNNTKSDFTAGATISPKTQDIDGAMLGVYATYFHNRFALDTAFKVDLFDVDQTTTGCGAAQTGTAGLTNYIVAANAYYRYDLHSQYWFEPTIGFRYLQSEFGDGADVLGLGDGHALRLQAGARIGRDWVENRKLWSVSVLGMIYSDVSVDGFNVGGAGNQVLETDEGEVRFLGQFRAKVMMNQALSYYGQVEVRGGEDYFGVGGKLGARVEW